MNGQYKIKMTNFKFKLIGGIVDGEDLAFYHGIALSKQFTLSSTNATFYS